jgi:hypothetical protein
MITPSSLFQHFAADRFSTLGLEPSIVSGLRMAAKPAQRTPKSHHEFRCEIPFASVAAAATISAFMELNRIVAKFVYRIEAKPEGGFIARANDPNIPAIEGATRTEVEQKVQASIHAELGTQFPALKQIFENHGINTSYHVEAKPEGGFIIRSNDPIHQPIEASSHDNIGDLIASKFISHFIQKLPPDVSQKVMSQLSSGGLNINVNRKLTVTTRDGTTVLSDDSASPNSSQPGLSQFPSGEPSTPFPNSLTPSSELRYEKGGIGKFFRLLLAALVLAAILYFVLRLR